MSRCCLGLSMAHIRYTHSAMIDGVPTKGFPVIISQAHEIDGRTLKYFFGLLRTRRVSSVRTCASHLLDLIGQLEVDQRALESLDEAWFTAYKKAILGRLNGRGRFNSENYACQVLRSVISYCHWIEQQGYARLFCGTSDLHAIQISQRLDDSISHPLFRDRSTDKRSSKAPRSEWIETVKAHARVTDDASLKTDLMFDWCSSAGTRAQEICSLTLPRLPSRTAAEAAAAGGYNLQVELDEAKGGSKAPLPVSAVLVLRTWDYVLHQRCLLLAKFKKATRAKREPYVEPLEIFISATTGRGMSARAFSNTVRRAFLRAVAANELQEEQRVWTHGLRHNYGTRLIRRLDEQGAREPERIAQVGTRHRSKESLEIYTYERFSGDFS